MDLWSKWAAFRSLAVAMPPRPDGRVQFDSDTLVLIPDWLRLHTTVNHGAVFGLGQGAGWFYVLIAIFAVAFLVFLFLTSGRQRLYQVILGMLLAGVLGNMYDRLVHGHVRDMIHALPGIHWFGQWQIPFLNYPAPPDRAVFPWVFNVADSLLCVGVALMLISSVRQKPSEGLTTTSKPVERVTGV